MISQILVICFIAGFPPPKEKGKKKIDFRLDIVVCLCPE